ncbi:hypothetical protein HU200_044910 [Digitaria exilis]|uniref:Uncharacterized protein n=1 Tax=Digitaria exilis TaxID=1010633 RepID=A0A835EE87_9POAL|nr:hypothetical protein HU200_044910 [Digitaria exilis]
MSRTPPTGHGATVSRVAPSCDATRRSRTRTCHWSLYVSRSHSSRRSIYTLYTASTASLHFCAVTLQTHQQKLTTHTSISRDQEVEVEQRPASMASRQDTREARAEADARRAVEELARARDEHLVQAEANARSAADEIARSRASHGAAAAATGGSGILGSVQEGTKSFVSAVGRTFGGAKDTAADKTSQTAQATGDKLGEYGGYTADKAREANDTVARKTNETAEATRNKLGEYKDAAVEKARETKDAVAHKTSEAAEATKNKLGEYKDAAAGKAREAMDATADKAREAKDATKQMAQETKDATADRAREARDVTKQKAGEYTDATRDTAQEARDRSWATAHTAADRVRETAGVHDANKGQAGPGLLGALGNVTGAIKEKLTLGGQGQGPAGLPHGMRLGDDDERTAKERAAEKAASVYFEEKDRALRERAAELVDRCVEKCVEGCELVVAVHGARQDATCPGLRSRRCMGE